MLDAAELRANPNLQSDIQRKNNKENREYVLLSHACEKNRENSTKQTKNIPKKSQQKTAEKTVLRKINLI